MNAICFKDIQYIDYSKPPLKGIERECDGWLMLATSGVAPNSSFPSISKP